MTPDVDGKQFSQDTRTSPYTAADFYRNNVTLGNIMVTWDRVRVRLYLDGKEQTRSGEGTKAWDSVAHFPAGQQTRINLGWRFGNWFCPCDIDSLTVYGRALNAKEIAARAAETAE